MSKPNTSTVTKTNYNLTRHNITNHKLQRNYQLNYSNKISFSTKIDFLDSEKNIKYSNCNIEHW